MAVKFFLRNSSDTVKDAVDLSREDFIEKYSVLQLTGKHYLKLMMRSGLHIFLKIKQSRCNSKWYKQIKK
jgi:hypothetical protein